MALILGAAATWIATPPAEANNYVGNTGNTTNCGAINPAHSLNNTDPNPLTFAYNSLESVTADAVEYARTSVYHPTRHDTSLLSSSNSLTDVVAFDQDYTTYCGLVWHPTGTTLGLAVCVSLASGNACERHEVRFDWSWMQNVSQTYRRSLGCHEVGHAVGLDHRDDGCMTNGSTFPTQISLHDVTHINGGSWIKPDADGVREVWNGKSMYSYDGRYRAWMQTDGNFVVYGPGCTGANGSCWASGTNGWGSGVWAVMQGDGNFVLYVSSAYGASALCSSRTNGHTNSSLEMQTDGNLVVYAPGHVAVWSTLGGGQCL